MNSESSGFQIIISCVSESCVWNIMNWLGVDRFMLDREKWESMSMDEKRVYADAERFVGIVRDMMSFVDEESRIAEFHRQWSYSVTSDYSFRAVMRVDVGRGFEEVVLVVPGEEWMSSGDLELGCVRVDEFGKSIDPSIYE